MNPISRPKDSTRRFDGPSSSARAGSETRRAGVEPELVTRAANGDREALESLVELMAPRLLRFASRLGCDATEQEDIVEECLYRGMSRIRQLRDPRAVAPWFFRILLNVWRDRQRHRARSEVTRADLSELPASASSDPLKLLDARELRRRVDEALPLLPPGQRAVIALQVDEGLSVREIAALLETTPDRVKANLYHARKRLKWLLRDLLEDDDSDRGPGSELAHEQ